MLTRLTIFNYALINNLTVDFDRGLNSVTGETGAGKSIILGALGLILGNRADLSVLKNREEKCIVEGFFDIGNYQLQPLFQKYDLDYDNITILRREITPSGKSRGFINDTPVNLKVMQKLGLKLIDIHSQHQNLELGNQRFQLGLVDTVSDSESVLTAYKERYERFMALQKELEELTDKAEQASADLDYFQFQFDQLNEANLEPDEQVELEAELEKLTHTEDIKSAFTGVQELLDNEHFSILHNLKEGFKLLDHIREYLDEAPALAERLHSCLLELQDIRDESERMAESTDHDPARIEAVNDRLNLIYNLQQKHRVTTEEELITLRNSFEEKILQVSGYDEEIAVLRKELDSVGQQLDAKAGELTAVRKKAFRKIEDAVLGDLRQLGMPKSKFTVHHEVLPGFTPTGRDSVAFLFSANADVLPVEISKVASGGEMSRLMLAVKNLLRTSRKLPTVIFDEIDSGVSGEIALKMGAILKAFSPATQIINITHLPQIAAKGDAHFVVYKYEKNGQTFTSVKQLTEPERIEELAKMVGGDKLSDTTLRTARELLGQS